MRAIPRPIYNSSLASDAGFLPLDDPTAPVYTIVPAKATVATKTGSPTLSLNAIALVPAKVTIATKVGSPTLALVAIALSPAAVKVATKTGEPTIVFITPGLHPYSMAVALEFTRPTTFFWPPPHVPRREYKQGQYVVAPKPPRPQIEVEMRAIMDVYKDELNKQKLSLLGEQERLSNLEMGRRQMEINRQLNRQPKEAKRQESPKIDDGMVQRMIAKAEKQRQQEIDMANKLKMARVRAAKRKPKAKK